MVLNFRQGSVIYTKQDSPLRNVQGIINREYIHQLATGGMSPSSHSSGCRNQRRPPNIGNRDPIVTLVRLVSLKTPFQWNQKSSHSSDPLQPAKVFIPMEVTEAESSHSSGRCNHRRHTTRCRWQRAGIVTLVRPLQPERRHPIRWTSLVSSHPSGLCNHRGNIPDGGDRGRYRHRQSAAT